LTGDNETRAVAYAAEAGLFQRAGIPAIICGPGSIEQAHQPDEWIERTQIEEGAAFMRRLIARLSA
jgi:acetylornithine deacetylase